MEAAEATALEPCNNLKFSCGHRRFFELFAHCRRLKFFGLLHLQPLGSCPGNSFLEPAVFPSCCNNRLSIGIVNILCKI